MRTKLALLGAPLLLLTAPVGAQEDGGCVYDRGIYPEGTEMCQGGLKMRCERGSWGEVGFCDSETQGPPPRSGGGDVEDELE